MHRVLFLFALLAAMGSPLSAQENQGEKKPRRGGFWIFSFEKKPLPPKDAMEDRMHSMEKLRVFDYITIFKLESEVKDYATRAYALKNRFTEREQIMLQERSSLTDELKELLHEEKLGRDRSAEILRNYKKLYINTKKMHELGIEHAADLQKLSQQLYEDYQKKVDTQLAAFENDPSELRAVLMKVHDQLEE